METQDPSQDRGVRDAARTALILDNLRLVKIIAARIHKSLPRGIAVTMDDLVQTGMVGLIEAADRYVVNDGCRFQSYAQHRIKGAMRDSLRKLDWASRAWRRDPEFNEIKFENLDYAEENLPGESSMEPEVSYRVGELRRLVGNAVGMLSARQKDVVVMRYGRGMTVTAIAIKMGVSGGRASQIGSRALRVLEWALEDAGIRGVEQVV